MLLGGQIAPLTTLDDERREDTAAIGAGVDADPVRPLLDLVDDRMAVDHDEPVIAFVAKERLADPAQVGAGLFFEPEARTDPRMDE